MRLSLLSLVIVTFVACLRDIPSRDALVGTWTVAEDSRQLLAGPLRTLALELTLRRDGTFAAVDAPGELVYTDSPARDKPLSGTGKWAMDETLGDHRISLSFLTVSGENNVRLPFHVDLLTSGTTMNPQLYFYRGDPDDRMIIAFVMSRH